MSPGDVTHEPEIFEAAIRKLRGNQMPPPGRDQPPAEMRTALVHWLEGTLDAAAEAAPNPGRIALHRLNRTEYANAIDDLFGLKVDVAALLPKDDESDGFDNVANVLKVSPSFLEQYIGAASVVSEMAVGNPAAKMDSRVFYAEPGTNQNFHRAGMPLGTRGGMLVEHFFPADGTYTITLGGLARARYVEGLEYQHTLIIAIDGKQVYSNTIGGPEDLANVDVHQAAAVAELNGRFERIRATVSAGPHQVAATFVARTLAESDAVLQPFIPGGGEVGIIEGEESPLKIERLQIDGPIDPTGVSDTPSRKKIFICRPASEAEELPCAKQIVAHLTRAAFRRPVTDADLETPLQFFASGRQAGGFDNGIRNAVMIVLASPDFLYRVGAPPEDRAPGHHLRRGRLRARVAPRVLLVEPPARRGAAQARGAGQASRRPRARGPGEAHARGPARRIARDELRRAMARRARRRRHHARSGAVRGVQSGSRRRVRDRAQAVPEERAARGPQRARALELRYDVRERAPRAALRHRQRARRHVPQDQARGREPLGPARQGRDPDGDVVPEPHGARAARRVDPRVDHGHAARGAAAERRSVPRERRGRGAAHRARAAREASREPVVQGLPRRDGPARLRARELRRDRRLAHEGSRDRRRRSTRRASSRTAAS